MRPIDFTDYPKFLKVQKQHEMSWEHVRKQIGTSKFDQLSFNLILKNGEFLSGQGIS